MAIAVMAVLTATACTKGTAAVSSIAIHPTNPKIIYVGTSKHIRKSRDGGETWVLSDQGLGGVRVISLAIDPNSPAQLFAGTFAEAVFKSWDGGQDWVPDNVGLKEHISIVSSIIFDPQIPEIMYLGSTVGVYKREGLKSEWQERTEGMESVYTVPLIADPRHPGTLYAGTSGGVYKSVDRAEHWKAMNDGLSIEAVGGALSHGVNAIVLHPTEPDTLYIGTTRGFFVSRDGAAHWTQNKTILQGSIAAVAIHPRDPSIIYAGGNGIFKSTDGGATWRTINTGLSNTGVRVLAMDPQDPDTLYAGTNGGLFKTVDGGQHWTLKKLED
ncbi:MAG TPA: hypothetical protein VML36_06020 [Nitrospiria bacterium]|nr:hypothetical protein [Nitrospiria bacterium]